MRNKLIKRPRKKMGQNFLSDRTILESIVQAAGVCKGDTVVEVGPGYGSLTKVLLENAGKVIAIELDDGLYENLKKEFASYDNLELVHADILDYPLDKLEGPFKLVANPPYYLSTPLLYMLIENRYNIINAVMTLQKEVAERVTATSSTKSYGSLTLYYNLFANSSICFEVDKTSFYPVPEVDSAVLKVEFLEESKVQVNDAKVFFKTVRASFSHRRKTLANSLKKSGMLPDTYKLEDRLTSIGIDPGRRAETLTLDEFVKMSDNLEL